MQYSLYRLKLYDKSIFTHWWKLLIKQKIRQYDVMDYVVTRRCIQYCRADIIRPHKKSEFTIDFTVLIWYNILTSCKYVFYSRNQAHLYLYVSQYPNILEIDNFSMKKLFSQHPDALDYDCK